MKSYRELSSIEKDLIKNRENITRVLDSGKEYMEQVVNVCISQVRDKRLAVEKSISEFSNVCTSQDF